ncbi:AMPE aminopeptidase, partial [Acromyrmex heyeri]
MKISMGFLILLLNSGLLLFGAADLISDKDLKHESLLKMAGNRLPDNIYPVRYVIQLDLHYTMNRHITSQGRCIIIIQINSPTNNINLHADTSQIHKLYFQELKTLYKEQKKETPYVLTFFPVSSTYNSKNNVWVFYFDKKIPPGSYSLNLIFEYAEVNSEGVFRTSFINDEGDTTWLVALDFLPIGARRIFPCWDEPRFLATFEIFMNIITYEYNYTILSNTLTKNITSYTLDFENIVQVEVSSRIPTYHLSAILLSHFATIKSLFFESKRIMRFPSLDDVTIDAFWFAIQDAYDISVNNVRLDVEQLMNAWTKQQHYPVVKVTRNNSNVTILIENMNEKNWWIPYTTATNANKRRPDFSLLTLQNNIRFPLVGEELNLNVGSNWIIVNVQQIGYYRVNYDKTSLGQISEYLNSDEHHINKIHVLNRAQIIDDAFYFFMRNEIDLNVFLNLTKYLWRETNFIAWYPMFKGLEYMSIFFHYQSINTIFVKTIKGNSDNLFDISLKEEISRWACILGSSECKKEAYSRLQRHLQNQTKMTAIVALIDIINHVYTKEQLNKIKACVIPELPDLTILVKLLLLRCVSQINFCYPLKKFLQISAMEIGMRFLILLLNSGLLHFGAADVFFIKDWKHERLLKFGGNRLPDNIYPIHYTIHLQLRDINHNTSVFGKCVIHMKIISLTQNISLHADELRIKELSFKGLKTLYKNRELTFFPVVSTYYSKNNVWAFMFEKELLPGFYNLNLTFAYLEADNKGLFRTSFINDEGDSTRLVALDFLPIGARRIFPCFDEPRFQTTFDIFITYKYVNYTILSNTPTIGLESVRDTIETMRFNVTPRIPTYHVSAILLSHFTTVKSLYFKNDLNLNIRYRQQLKPYYIFFIRSIVDDITLYFISQEHLKNTTNITHVLIPGFRHDAVSNLGLIYYRETAVIFSEEEDPLMRQPEIARLIGRSIAYQCFRNRIGPSWWSYMWLIEGITTLFALDAIDENFPNFRIKDLFVVQTLQESLRFDDNFVMKPLITEIQIPSEIESIFSMSYYMKGYYRVNYDKITLGQISEYLMSDDINKIHVLNRAQIIDDAFYFFIKKETDLNVFLALTKYLQQETDFIAWYPMFKGLEYMSIFFHYQSINTIFVKTIKGNSDNLFDISLKEEISRWACILGSSECKKEAYSRLQRHLQNQTVLSWWKEWTYCNGLMIADNNTWYSVLDNTNTEKYDLPNYMYLKFIACSEDFFIIRNYIEMIRSAKFYNETQKDYGQVYIFHFVVERHAKNDTMLDYILANLDEIKPRFLFEDIYRLNS